LQVRGVGRVCPGLREGVGGNNIDIRLVVANETRKLK